MPIIKRNHLALGSSITSPTEEYFTGRVLEVVNLTERRDWSDTLDYTDFRTTNSIYALVWLGTHNYAPRSFAGRPRADHECLRPSTQTSPWAKPRDLDFHEQFAWVDCTNMFSDRHGYTLVAAVDASPTDGVEPLMWANYHAWMAYQAAVTAEATRRAEAARMAREEAEQAAAQKAAAAAAKKAARIAASQPAAEALLAKVPPKGTTVTVDGITGKVAWMGTKVYRGRWSARVGVKDAVGQMHWVDAAKVAR